MYKIGEFSKIVDIPVRTLRFYDEHDVLKPNYIDNYTGYRYYTDENILECETIKLLKSVNFTLEEITMFKNNLNNEILGQKQEEILEQINLLKIKLERLAIMKEKLQSKNDEKNYINILNESENERVLRRKYERRNIKKNNDK